ncbi:MAG: transposase [Thermodesulfobacteriota bacterium]|nr:transposase [Thermodesulfobacteriota bacterium]
MGRPIRIQYPGALYHITSRGNERRDIFVNDNDRQKFLGILSDYHDRYGIVLHCYVLMDNHYHLLLETPLGNLVKVMHGLNSNYTGYFNRRYARTGHLFQGRYKAIIVDKDAYLLELSRYVHLNPVRAGIVNRPGKYAWSSYPGYIRKSKRVDWVEYVWILSHFGPGGKAVQTNYRQYVTGAIEKDQDSPLKQLYGQVVLGDDEFIEKIKVLLKKEKISEEIVERTKLTDYPRPDKILGAVASAFGQPQYRLVEKQGRNNTAKKVAIYLMKRYTCLGNKEIAHVFGGLHYSAVSKAVARLERELSKDKDLAKRVEKTMSYVKYVKT